MKTIERSAVSEAGLEPSTLIASAMSEVLERRCKRLFNWCETILFFAYLYLCVFVFPSFLRSVPLIVKIVLAMTIGLCAYAASDVMRGRLMALLVCLRIAPDKILAEVRRILARDYDRRIRHFEQMVRSCEKTAPWQRMNTDDPAITRLMSALAALISARHEISEEHRKVLAAVKERLDVA